MREQGRALSAALVAELDAVRRQAGLSHEELALRAGAHRTSIGLIMSGKRGVTVEMAGALSLALGESLSEVLARAEAQTATDADAAAAGPSA